MLTSYVIISILVGVGQIVEGVHVYLRRGRLSGLAIHFGLFEYVWAAISTWILYTNWNESDFPHWLPALFLTYVVFGMVWGFFEFKDMEIDPEADLEPILTPTMVYMGIVFGALFASASTYVFVVY